MPIYEYICSKCGKEFEELIQHPDDEVKCPVCGSMETDKLFSLFARSCKGCETAGSST